MMFADRQPVGRRRADGDVERERRAVGHRPGAVGSAGVAGLVEDRVGAVDVAVGPVAASRHGLVAPGVVPVGQARAVGRVGVALHRDLGDGLTVDRHAQRLADLHVVEGRLGRVQLPVDHAVGRREPEVPVVRVLGDEGVLDVGDELVGPVRLAVGGRQVGGVVAGEGQHLDALDLLLVGLPVARGSSQAEGLALEADDLRVRAGADRRLVRLVSRHRRCSPRCASARSPAGRARTAPGRRGW